MSHQDQASNLSDKHFDVNSNETIEVVDVQSLPTRTERRRKEREQQKKTSASINWHLWVTRGIAFLFICLLVGLIVYFSSEQWSNIPNDKTPDNLLKIIR
ncbi:hypothetical protein [Pseudalkalibacillus decolorationis]|uniref:hypothetical protein n=1 Tax=Pseudalkalibacillus decolorationis TaxID=163879 RepID=UPI002148F664|nr:hypothetical protein [Pseudalkalibacillus decolorationis]